MSGREPTKDEQIKSLKRQRAELLETVELQNQRINQLQQEAEEEFLNSPSYQQMKAKLKNMQSLQDINNMIIKQQRANIEQQRESINDSKRQFTLTIRDLKSILAEKVLIYREKNNKPELTDYDEIFEDLYRGLLYSAPVWLLNKKVKMMYPEKKNLTAILVE